MPADATQRVHIDKSNTGVPQRPAGRPQTRPSGAAPARPSARPASAQPQRRPAGSTATPPARKKKSSASRRKNNAIIISLFSIAAVLLVAIIITISGMFSVPEDDGLILNNVYAAGVNLGGKTPEQAKQALQAETDYTYTKFDMTVTVLDTVVTLTPARTGAELDVNAVVQAAYNYGRTGSLADYQKAKQQAMISSYHIPIIEYLNLDLAYIQEVVDNLGTTYSSMLTRPTDTIEGDKPDLNMDNSLINTETVYQTLNITIGTPEYGLDTDLLYDQILEAYNSNIFQVEGKCSVVLPESLDAQALYNKYGCTAPVDAQLDPDTYEVIPEVYGYGFKLEDLQVKLEAAKYGDKLEIPMTFIAPLNTAESLAGDLFTDILASYTIPAATDKNLIINLKLATRAIGEALLLSVGDEFSFNDIIGDPAKGGYKEVMANVGLSTKEVVGGGLSQLSSALYYCALMSDLEILERHAHTYAPDFIELGLDADILYGSKDLIFRNTTDRPIRIVTDILEDGSVSITIWGTKKEDCTVEIIYETINTYNPITLKQQMLLDNPGDYKAGDLLVKGIAGFDVNVYKVYRYSGENADLEPEQILVSQSRYEKRNAVVVEIAPEVVPDPSVPDTTGSSNPTYPSTGSTDPSEPTASTGSTEPSEPSGNTEPSTNATTPSGGSDPSQD